MSTYTQYKQYRYYAAKKNVGECHVRMEQEA